jgi:hypothetical protein
MTALDRVRAMTDEACSADCDLGRATDLMIEAGELACEAYDEAPREFFELLSVANTVVLARFPDEPHVMALRRHFALLEGSIRAQQAERDGTAN